jgi:hypothetical protein
MAEHLRHLDAPIDYDIELVVGPLSRLDDEGVPASLHPGPVDAGLDNDVRELAVTSVLERIVAALRSGASRVEATHTIASLNLKIQAVLTDIRPASEHVPRREWLIHGWPASGYAPEGMFERLARRRVRQKMRRGQAAAAGLGTSLLIVDLAQVPLALAARQDGVISGKDHVVVVRMRVAEERRRSARHARFRLAVQACRAVTPALLSVVRSKRLGCSIEAPA